MSVWPIVITLFLVANPVGNSPAIIALIKEFDFAHQKRIMLRESILSFFLALFFQFCGEMFLGLLKVESYTVKMCGGILLFLVAINMIFPKRKTEKTVVLKQEPILVPIATPLITGPALLTIIMLYSHQEPSVIKLTTAIVISWIGISAVLVSAPYINRIVGKRGLMALEQLMGLILTMMSIEMIISGIHKFMGTLSL